MENHQKEPRHLDMLLTCKSIAENFSTCLHEVCSLNSNWSEEYAATLNTRIDELIEQEIGIEKKLEIESTFTAMRSNAHLALGNLIKLRNQINHVFRYSAKEAHSILLLLGFDKYWEKAEGHDLTALADLLQKVKEKYSSKLGQELTSRGIDHRLFQQLAKFSKEFSRHASSEGDTSDLFNSIYDEVIQICKLCQSYYQYNAQKRMLFNFSELLVGLKN